VTVEPDGSHWEKNANAGGSSGGETAPPEDALPSTTTNSHVGRIAQRPIKAAISEVNEAAATRARTGTGRQDALAPWSARHMYLNFAETPREAATFWTEQAHHGVRRIKAAVDPENIIRANHPIPPSASYERPQRIKASYDPDPLGSSG
jgi:hypothetical protein